MSAHRTLDGTPTVEWPTLAVLAGVLAGFGLLIRFGARLPWPITALGLAIVAGWHASYQHESVHGHPTRWRWLNTVLAWIPLGLVYPYARYVDTHSAHHDAEDQLTIPGIDPESNYVTPEVWERSTAIGRAWLWAHRTLAGRLILGPARMLGRFCWGDLRAIVRGDGRLARVWLAQILGAAGMLWLATRWGLPWWVYVLGAGYAGTAVTMLRSFAEHRDVAEGCRTAYVDAGWFFSLLYLNNNLHHAHHKRPDAPWYRLPLIAQELHSADISEAGAGRYRGGYLEQFRRHLLKPLGHPVNSISAKIGA